MKLISKIYSHMVVTLDTVLVLIVELLVVLSFLCVCDKWYDRPCRVLYRAVQPDP